MIKRNIVLVVILTLIISSMSCSSQNTEKETTEPLSIYMLEYDNYLKDAISSFNNSGKTKAIEEKTFFNDQYEEYSKQLQAELSSGGGPDIIAIPADLLPNLSKYVKKGSFYDLNELIRNDKEFKPGDYNEQIMNSGVVNDGRYFMPISYTLDTLFTTKEILDENNLDTNKTFLSLDDLASMAASFTAKESGNGKYLMDEFGIFTFGISGLTDALYGQANPDTAGIAQMMDKYKSLSGALYPSSQLTRYGGNEFSKRLKNGEVAYLSYPVGGFRMLADPYSAFESEVVPEICALSFGNGGKSVSTRPYEIVAINANCKDKEKAYKFIKLLLSKEMQTSSYIYGLPVNTAAYEAQKEEFIKSSQSTGGVKNSESIEKLAQELDELVKGQISCGLTDADALSIMYGEFLAFQNGEKSSGDAADSMRQKLSEYRDKGFDVAKATESAPSAEAEDIPVLTIQYMDYDLAVKNAIRSFSEKQQDVKIESEVFSNNSYEEYITKLTTGIMAGEGPDILYYRPQIFNSLRKTMSTGVFCDLNELIANDDTFKELDLNDAALESGVYEGKRYYLPLRYQLPLLVSTKGILDKNGIAINDNWTLDDFKKTVLDYANGSGNRYFFSYSMNFILLLDGCGMDFIGYETRTSHFQSQEFIDIMKLYKDIFPYIMPYDDATGSELPAVLMQNSNFVMDANSRFSPEQAYMENSIYKDVLGEEPVLYSFPTAGDGSGRSVRIGNVASINAACKNKQQALDFIEELLSESVQMAIDQYGNSNITLGLPINQKALSKDLDYFVNRTSEGGTIGTATRTFTPIPLPESLSKRITDLCNGITGTQGRDQAVNSIINEAVQNFIDGKRTAEQAAKDIDDKVTLFLNE